MSTSTLKICIVRLVAERFNCFFILVNPSRICYMNSDSGVDEIIVKTSVRDCGVKRRARCDVPVYSCILSEGAGLCSLYDIKIYRYRNCVLMYYTRGLGANMGVVGDAFTRDYVRSLSSIACIKF